MSRKKSGGNTDDVSATDMATDGQDGGVQSDSLPAAGPSSPARQSGPRLNPPRYWLTVEVHGQPMPRVLAVVKSYRAAVRKRDEAAGMLGIPVLAIAIRRVKHMMDDGNGQAT